LGGKCAKFYELRGLKGVGVGNKQNKLNKSDDDEDTNKSVTALEIGISEACKC